MNIEKIPFIELPLFHQLIQDYLSENKSIENLITDFPSKEALFKQSQIKEFPQHKRQLLFSRFGDQYRDIKIGSETRESIDSLLEPNTYTITTGHQLCLATGPLYVLIKISSVIALTKELNKDYPTHNFVPVFWMATEDHDFEEINHYNVLNEKFQYETTETGPVGKMKTKEALDQVEKSYENFNQNELSEKWWDILKEAYKKESLSKAYRSIIHEIFKDYGLLILDGDDKELKESFKSIIIKELTELDSQNIVQKTLASFKSENYKIQVNPRAINLFYVHENGRDRITYEDSLYKVLNTDIEFQNIEKEVDLHPEKFSPNVILRPLYQESILPNIAMIGGGGELSYWLELKGLFEKRGVQFPILILRDSVLFMKKKSRDFLKSHDITLDQLFENQERIRKQIGRSSSDFDPKNYQDELSIFYDKLGDDIGSIDQQLKVSTEQNKAKALKDLDNLTKRLDRVLKSKSEVELNRFNKIVAEVFPSGIFQERWVNPAEIILIFGLDLVDELISNLQPLKNELTIFIK